MIWATLNPKDPVVTWDSRIIIEGLRDAGGPSKGEPVRLTLDSEEAKIVIESLQAILKAKGK